MVDYYSYINFSIKYQLNMEKTKMNKNLESWIRSIAFGGILACGVMLYQGLTHTIETHEQERIQNSLRDDPTHQENLRREMLKKNLLNYDAEIDFLNPDFYKKQVDSAVQADNNSWYL